MEYRFVHHWQYEPGLQEEAILQTAVDLVNCKRGKNFILEAASFISKHTTATYVVVGLISEDSQRVHTCVFLKHGVPLPNFTYPLNGTPCDAVLTQRFCFYPSKVTESFPDDQELKEFNIESYLGSVLTSEENELLGLVAIMDEKTIDNAAFAEHLILILSPAIEEELAKYKTNMSKF